MSDQIFAPAQILRRLLAHLVKVHAFAFLILPCCTSKKNNHDKDSTEPIVSKDCGGFLDIKIKFRKEPAPNIRVEVRNRVLIDECSSDYFFGTTLRKLDSDLLFVVGGIGFGINDPLALKKFSRSQCNEELKTPLIATKNENALETGNFQYFSNHKKILEAPPCTQTTMRFCKDPHFANHLSYKTFHPFGWC